MTAFAHSVALVLVLLAGPSSVWAAGSGAEFPIRIEINDYGIYQMLEKPDRAFHADTTAGYASVVKTRLLAEVDKIPLRAGTVFGFNFAIADTTTDQQWVPIMIRIKHPVTTNYLGQRSNGFSKSSQARLKADGRYHNGAFYVFSEPYEMVPGDWKISVIYRDEILVSKSFTVLAVNGAADP